jgi:hypothetical protein
VADGADVAVEETIKGTPNALYALVSDVTRMGEWSPETTACAWLGDASGAAVGARFRGANRRGWRRWSTTCTVVDADPGRRFAFDVRIGPFEISQWAYEFAGQGDGCVVRETWTDRRPGWMKATAPFAMGVRDQAGFNREGMQTTLAALRRFAESSTG